MLGSSGSCGACTGNISGTYSSNFVGGGAIAGSGGIYRILEVL